MTTRFRDMHEFASRDEAEAARLLRGLAPAVPSAATEQRVYARLGRGRRLAPRIMRLAVVAGGAVLVTAVLGTALAMSFRYVAAQRKSLATSLPHAHVGHVSPEPRAVALVPTIPRQAVPQAIPAASNPSPSGLEREQEKARPLAAPQPAPLAVRKKRPGMELSGDESAKAEIRLPTVEVTESTAARAAAAPAEEAALVLAGLRLLRRDHEPARAGVLFGRYLERFPEGALVQEALALAIEASVAKGDGRGAAGLAEQYLARFPAGRFSSLAHKVAGPRP
jgi:TolA-binding protein